MTSFNYNDFTEWASIGFYPDTSTSFAFNQFVAATPAGTNNGIGVSNNQNLVSPCVPAGTLGQATIGNIGFLKRQQYFAYNGQAVGTSGNVAYAS